MLITTREQHDCLILPRMLHCSFLFAWQQVFRKHTNSTLTRGVAQGLPVVRIYNFGYSTGRNRPSFPAAKLMRETVILAAAAVLILIMATL